MKKINDIMLLTAALAASLACQKAEINEQKPQSEGRITVLVTTEEISTRTAFGTLSGDKYPTLWQAGDEVKFSLNNAEGVSATAEVVEGGATANFSPSFTDAEAESYTIYAVSPAGAATSFAENSISVNIPSVQTSGESSCDPAAQLLYAQSETSTEKPAEFKARFQHLTSYLKVNLVNLPEGVVPAKLRLDFGAPVSGAFVYTSDALAAAASALNTLEATTVSDDIWFACAPVDVSEKTIKVELVATDGLTYSTTKTFPANRVMQAGTVYGFSINMADAKVLYEKTLTPGEEGFSMTGGKIEDGLWKGLNYWEKHVATYTFADVPVAGEYDIILDTYYWLDIVSSLSISVNGAAADSYLIRGKGDQYGHRNIVIKGVALNAGENSISVTAGSVHKGNVNSATEKMFPNAGWMTVTNCPNDYVQSEKVIKVSLTPGQAGVEADPGTTIEGSLVKGIWHWSERGAKFTFEDITAGVYNITVNIDWWCSHEVSTGIRVNNGDKLSARVKDSSVKSVLFENVQLTEGTNVILVGKGDYNSLGGNPNPNDYPNIGTVTIRNY